MTRHYFQGALRRRRRPGGLGDERLPGGVPAAPRLPHRLPREPRRHLRRAAARPGALRRGRGARATRATSAATPAPTSAASLTGRTPVGRLPRPDLLACCTNICQTVLYWYRALADHFQVPLVLVDTPFVYGEAKPHHVALRERPARGAASRSPSGCPGGALDPEALAEVARLAKEGTDLWGECLATGQDPPGALDRHRRLLPHGAHRGAARHRGVQRLLPAAARRARATGWRRGIGGLARGAAPPPLGQPAHLVRGARARDAARPSAASTSSARATRTPGPRPASRIDPADPDRLGGRHLHAHHPEPGPAEPARHPAPPGARVRASTARSSTATAPASPTRSARST